MIKEACVETIEACRIAQTKGANRIELCANLKNDGLTPSEDLILQAVEELDIPVRVMIRPSADGFLYSREEIEKMKASISFCKENGVEGVVFGVCSEDHTLDLAQISILAKQAKPMKVVIHKAIDTCSDPVGEIEKLVKLNLIDAVLSSGKEKTALEGLPLLKKMKEATKGQLELVVCGKITNQNLEHMHNMIGASSYHGKLIVGDLSAK